MRLIYRLFQNNLIYPGDHLADSLTAIYTSVIARHVRSSVANIRLDQRKIDVLVDEIRT